MQRVGYREIEEMGEGAGHHVLWEGKYITRGCAASAPVRFLGWGGTMQSSRRHLLLLSFAAVPEVLLRFQGSPPQHTSHASRRRPDDSDDASTAANSTHFP